MPKELVYVVFTDSMGEKHWWAPFLHRHIKHCFAYARSGEGWTMLNVKHNGLDVLYSASKTVHQDIIKSFPDCTILPVHSRDPLWPFIKLPLFSCVEAVRHWVGVDEVVATPKQLYDVLVSRGYLAVDELPYILQEQLHAHGQV